MDTKNKKSKKSGFVILFAVTISAIILAIALGVANISLKEVQFGTSARDTNDAFFAADTGIEYVLFQDLKEKNHPLDSIYKSNSGFGSEIVGLLGGNGKGCAIVTITKTTAPSLTTVVSKGYNTGSNAVGDPVACNPIPSSIEREIKITY